MSEEMVVSAEENTTQMPKFGWKDKIGYAMGDFGCNMSFSLIASFMADFYTQYIGITASVWAIIIILTKIWDGVNDPIMGGIMDSVKIGKSGSKFKPWMKIGMFGLIVAGALVFLPIPNAPMWLKITLCIVTYLAWDIFYTILNVPYGALNSAISSDTVERTQLSTWRSIGAGLGGLLCMLLPMLVYDDNNEIIGGRMIWIGLAMGVIAFFAYFGCLKLTTERVKSLPETGKTGEKTKYNYLQTLKGFFKNRPLIAMCIASFALIVFFMSSSQTTKWLFQVHFGNAGTALTIASIATYVPMVLFIPFTGKLVKRFGKRLSAGVPLVISIIASIVMICVPFSADTKGAVGYIAGLMFVQLGGGVFQLICWAMITDCVDYQQIKTGKREEGSVYAMYSLFRKIAQGVALSLPLLCMTWVGYNPRANPIGNQAAGVSEKMVTMSVGLMLIGAVMMLISLLVIYNLGRKQVEEISATLGKTNEIDINSAIENRND